METIKISREDMLELTMRREITNGLSAENLRVGHLLDLTLKDFGEYAEKILAKYKVEEGAKITQINSEKNQIVIETDGKNSS